MLLWYRLILDYQYNLGNFRQSKYLINVDIFKEEVARKYIFEKQGKDLKFLASTWVSNGWKTRSFGQVISDYSGNDGSSSFALDSRGGKAELFDFDFGFMYAMNETFRIGIHFNQPYIDFYWEFYEF